MTRHRYSRSQKAGPWITVAVLIVGALLVGAGVVAGSWPLAAVGVAIVAVCLAVTVVLQRRGGSAPISFARQFPDTTVGPRATSGSDSSPPIDTDPTGAGARSSR